MLYIQADNGEMIPLIHVEEVDLTVDSEMDDIVKGYISSEPLTIDIENKMCKLRAFAVEIFLYTGDAFYMRFPKKLRRKLRRINRRNLLRSSP